jgi:hypothetical protein
MFSITYNPQLRLGITLNGFTIFLTYISELPGTKAESIEHNQFMVADNALAWVEYPRPVEDIAGILSYLTRKRVPHSIEFKNAPVMCGSASRTARVAPLLP